MPPPQERQSDEKIRSPRRGRDRLRRRASALTGEAADGLASPRRYLAILSLSFGTALAVIDGAIATVALPTIARDLGVDNAAVVLVVTVYQLVLVMSLLPFSTLGDRLGHRRLFCAGQILFVVATLLCFFARSLTFLLALRALQALGAAAMLSVSSALLRAVYPSTQLGRGLGINSVVVSVSTALSPTVGGLVLSVAPWPWVFASAVPFALVSLAVSRALPAVPPRLGSFDSLGALLCAMTFGLVISGLQGSIQSLTPWHAGLIVALGMGVGVVSVRRELTASHPILPVDLLAEPIVALSSAGALSAFMASMTLLVALPFRLEHVYGLSPGAVGGLIAPWPLTMMIVAPLAGALSDRYPSGALGAIGMTVATIGLVLMAYLPAHPDYWDIAWRMSLTGGGFGLFLSPNARVIIGAAPRVRAASAGGLISTTRLFGQTLGAIIAATLLALERGNGPVPALVAAGLAIMAGFCSVARLSPSLTAGR